MKSTIATLALGAAATLQGFASPIKAGAKRWYDSNGNPVFDPTQPGVIGQYPDSSINSTYGLATFDFDAILVGLNLELLELNLYNQALTKLAGQFDAYGPSLQPAVTLLRNQEIDHSTLLNTLAGGSTQNCTYTFPFFDVQSFLKLSQIVTSVGEGAYLGAVPNLIDPDYQAVFGAIIGNEARQNSFQRNETGLAFFNSVNYDTAITPSIAVALATGFISGCPSSNPNYKAAAKPLTYLNVTFTDSNINSFLPGAVNQLPQTYDEVQINYPATLPNGEANTGLQPIDGLSVAWIQQLNPVTFTPLYSNYTTYLPPGIGPGTAFVIITDISSGYYNGTNPIPDANTYAAGAIVVG